MPVPRKRHLAAPIHLATMAVCVGAGSAALAQVEHEFSVEAFAGIEFDDNITVQQVDVETGQDDFAAVFDLGLEWEMDFDQSNSLDLGYSLNYSQQFDLTGFDLMTQGGRVGYQHEFDSFNFGTTYRFFYSRLGGDPFLTLNRIEPYVSFFPVKSLFVRGTYIYQDKAFKNRTARDADTNMGQLDLFYFADGVDTFLSTSYRFETEDTFAPQFDFDAHIFRVGLHTRLPIAAVQEDRFKITLEYEGRNYDSITPSIGEIRDDDRLTLDVSWEVPLTEWLFALAEYRYRDFDSNLPSADYTENVASIQFGVKF